MKWIFVHGDDEITTVEGREEGEERGGDVQSNLEAKGVERRRNQTGSTSDHLSSVVYSLVQGTCLDVDQDIVWTNFWDWS